MRRSTSRWAPRPGSEFRTCLKFGCGPISIVDTQKLSRSFRSILFFHRVIHVIRPDDVSARGFPFILRTLFPPSFFGGTTTEFQICSKYFSELSSDHIGLPSGNNVFQAGPQRGNKSCTIAIEYLITCVLVVYRVSIIATSIEIQ